jgi:hypothetical protein
MLWRGVVLALPLVCTARQAQAQRPRPAATQATANRSATQPASTARAQAPFDLTGYWVSLVTENWRYRMVVPQRGDYAGIPVNANAKKFADAWRAAADIAAGRQCEAYGVANLMQVPERLHIAWQDDETLRVDTDAGMQTRLLHFRSAPAAAAASRAGGPSPPSAASLQGDSRAHWQVFELANTFGAPEGGAGAPRYGSLVVTTDHLLPGLLRKNGVPYGAQTKVAEYWKLNALGEDRWLMISTEVRDPEYLSGPYVYDSIFQQEPDGSKWNPSQCSLTK